MGEMKPFTRKELDAAKCTDPSCTHEHDGEGLFFNALCHPGEGVTACYKDGILRLECQVCDMPIVDIAVADEPSTNDWPI